MVADRRWRALAATATTTALLLGAAVPSVAQEGDDEAPTEAAMVCEGGEVLDDTDGEPFLLVEPGATITCTAEGLDEALASELIVDFYGITADDDVDVGDEFDDEEPFATEEQTLDPGVDTFTFEVPDELLIGELEGLLYQGDPEAPSYEAWFGGLILGDFLADMVCTPDPVEVGSEVSCDVEDLSPGEFDWEVHFLTVDELLEAFFGEGDLDEPGGLGTAVADEDGAGAFTFTAQDAELYLAIAEDEASFAFYAGEIVAASDAGAAPPPAAPQPPVEEPQDDEPQAAPLAPRRVDAGEGPTGPSPVSVLALAALAGLFGVSAQRGLARR